MTKLRLAAYVLPIVAIAGLSACAKPEAAKPAVDTAKIAETVKADVAGLVGALNGHDVEKAVGHDAPNYVGMFHGAPNVNGSAEDLALTKQQVADPAFKLAVANESVDVAAAGDMAIYRATYTATVTDVATKKVVNESGNWVVQYKAQPDGSWKIALGVVSDTPAAAAPAAPATK